MVAAITAEHNKLPETIADRADPTNALAIANGWYYDWKLRHKIDLVPKPCELAKKCKVFEVSRGGRCWYFYIWHNVFVVGAYTRNVGWCVYIDQDEPIIGEVLKSALDYTRELTGAAWVEHYEGGYTLYMDGTDFPARHPYHLPGSDSKGHNTDESVELQCVRAAELACRLMEQKEVLSGLLGCRYQRYDDWTRVDAADDFSSDGDWTRVDAADDFSSDGDSSEECVETGPCTSFPSAIAAALNAVREECVSAVFIHPDMRDYNSYIDKLTSLVDTLSHIDDQRFAGWHERLTKFLETIKKPKPT